MVTNENPIKQIEHLQQAAKKLDLKCIKAKQNTWLTIKTSTRQKQNQKNLKNYIFERNNKRRNQMQNKGKL